MPGGNGLGTCRQRLIPQAVPPRRAEREAQRSGVRALRGAARQVRRAALQVRQCSQHAEVSVRHPAAWLSSSVHQHPATKALSNDVRQHLRCTGSEGEGRVSARLKASRYAPLPTTPPRMPVQTPAGDLSPSQRGAARKVSGREEAC